MNTKEEQLAIEGIMGILNEVKDPEIPVISVVEMGLIRDVTLGENGVVVKMTPTFSGCPALHVIKSDIVRSINEHGFQNVDVETILDPPWSSDWITDSGREKLKSFGLAPPVRHGGRVELTFFEPAVCPYCDSRNTVQKNPFGPTLCRTICYCNDCQQPFEQFKAL